MLDRHSPFSGRFHYSQPYDFQGSFVILEHFMTVCGFPDDTIDRFERRQRFILRLSAGVSAPIFDEI